MIRSFNFHSQASSLTSTSALLQASRRFCSNTSFEKNSSMAKIRENFFTVDAVTAIISKMSKSQECINQMRKEIAEIDEKLKRQSEDTGSVIRTISADLPGVLSGKDIMITIHRADGSAAAHNANVVDFIMLTSDLAKEIYQQSEITKKKITDTVLPLNDTLEAIFLKGIESPPSLEGKSDSKQNSSKPTDSN